MPEDARIGVKPRVEVDGSPLAADVEVLLEQVVVDDHLHLPDMFLLRFRDVGSQVVRQARLQIASRVRISAPGASGGSELLIEPVAAGPWSVATTAPTVCTGVG
jgi:hypothetical protein